MLDSLDDTHAAALHRWTRQGLQLPDFVKAAGTRGLFEGTRDGLDPALCAQGSRRKFACHDAAATHLSCVYFRAQPAEVQDTPEGRGVARRLRKFAAAWGVDWDATVPAPAKQAADPAAAYARDLTQFRATRGTLRWAVRKQAAACLLDRAPEDLPREDRLLLERSAACGEACAKSAGFLLQSLAVQERGNLRASLTKLAAAVNAGRIRDWDRLIDLADTLDFRGRRFAKRASRCPEDRVFTRTPLQADEAARAVLRLAS